MYFLQNIGKGSFIFQAFNHPFVNIRLDPNGNSIFKMSVRSK